VWYFLFFILLFIYSADLQNDVYINIVHDINISVLNFTIRAQSQTVSEWAIEWVSER
jgi:hypothetical protein